MKIVPLTDAVSFPFFTQNINERHEFSANDISVKAANKMLSELVRWTKGLKLIKEISKSYAGKNTFIHWKAIGNIIKKIDPCVSIFY